MKPGHMEAVYTGGGGIPVSRSHRKWLWPCLLHITYQHRKQNHYNILNRKISFRKKSNYLESFSLLYCYNPVIILYLCSMIIVCGLIQKLHQLFQTLWTLDNFNVKLILELLKCIEIFQEHWVTDWLDGFTLAHSSGLFWNSRIFESLQPINRAWQFIAQVCAILHTPAGYITSDNCPWK